MVVCGFLKMQNLLKPMTKSEIESIEATLSNEPNFEHVFTSAEDPEWGPSQHFFRLCACLVNCFIKVFP